MNRTLVALLCMAAAVLVVATNEPRAEEKGLNFYNWSDYIPDSVLKQFTKATGIKVNASTFDSNETLYSKIKTLKGKAYDVVMPSTYFVSRMRKEGLLLKLDKAKLPNSKNLDPSFSTSGTTRATNTACPISGARPESSSTPSTCSPIPSNAGRIYGTRGSRGR
jgi:spermidine/putrescine transport system substrate-binding protein